MNTIIRVSSTSIRGVTLIPAPRAPPPAIENDIESSSASRLARACLQHQTPGTRREFPWRTVLLFIPQVRERVVRAAVAAETRSIRLTFRVLAEPMDKAPRAAADSVPRRNKSNTQGKIRPPERKSARSD